MKTETPHAPCPCLSTLIRFYPIPLLAWLLFQEAQANNLVIHSGNLPKGPLSVGSVNTQFMPWGSMNPCLKLPAWLFPPMWLWQHDLQLTLIIPVPPPSPPPPKSPQIPFQGKSHLPPSATEVSSALSPGLSSELGSLLVSEWCWGAWTWH